MPRPKAQRARRIGWLTAVAVVLWSGPVAQARISSPAPHITHAPHLVHWRADFSISGWLENGEPGMEVALQRRRLGRPFRHVKTKAVASDETVSFSIWHATRTADYRLAYRDASGERFHSEVRRVRVRAAVGLHLSTRNAYVGRRVVLRGHVLPATPGRRVILQQKLRGSWRKIASPSVADGSFRVRWHPKHKGRRHVRVRFTGDALNSYSRKGARLRVYVKDPATWYGPGFYGRRTACGKRLTRRTLGVAHRHLPCGTRVSFMYHGNLITVPVIDRGPYSEADWDLTRATAQRLSFSGSNKVGSTR